MATEPNDDTITAEEITGALLRRQPDAVQRYRLVTQLQATHLRYVQALCAAQLVAEGRSVAQIADQVGLTRQAVDALLRDSELPLPRHAATGDQMTTRLGYRLGVLLALYAEAAAASRNIDEFEKRLGYALSGHALPHTWPERGRRWLRGVHPRAHRERLLAEIEPAEAVLGEVPAFLSMRERSDLLIGYHSRRARSAE